VTVALGLLAALAFAFGTVLQQRGGLDVPDTARSGGFLVRLFAQPVWLAGALLQAAGWVLQGAALNRGPLILVQALTTLSLVIALPLGVRFTGQHVGRVEIGAAIAVVAGIVVFIVAGQPAEGSTDAAAATWSLTALIAAVAMWIVWMLARGRSGSTASALLGVAAGAAYAFQAAVTKEFVGHIGSGVGALLATWSTYALIVSALAGFAFQQSALRAGSLAAAMASSNASTLVFSVVFGATAFGETLRGSGGRVGLSIAGLVLAVAGVARLAATDGVADEPGDRLRLDAPSP
jgi:drug/metabolite transporter (DMT)-like permease